MEKSKVSVIIPSYNLEEYIEKTLKKLECQVYKNIEILVVNDGSSDKTSELAKEVLSKTNLNYKVIDKPNGGVSDARNVGIDNATGEYVTFLDGDDYMDDKTIQKFVEEFEKTNADFIYCGTKIVDENEKVLKLYPESSLLDKSLTGKELIIKLLKQEVDVIHPSSFFCKMDIINKYNVRFTKGCANGEDQEFYFKYLCHCEKVTSINEFLCYYVQRSDSISNSAKLSKFTALEAFDRIKDYINAYINDKSLDSLLENKYKREFFTNFNSIVKFYDGGNDRAYDVLKKYKYILDMGDYKAANTSKSEKIFAARYSMMRRFPKLYVNLFKFIYKQKGN